MRIKIEEKIAIPSGVECEISGKELICKKDGISLTRKVNVPGIKCSAGNNEIVFTCEAGNKNHYKIIKTQIAHVKNMFSGLNEMFVYNLQAVNVHFPMTLKVEGDRLAITNFLGEKVKRYANIIPGVDVQVKGQEVVVSSHDIEKAGHTAANIEKATRIRFRDRRVFQDGIFLTSKRGIKI